MEKSNAVSVQSYRYSRSSSIQKNPGRTMTLEDFEKSLLEGRESQRDYNLKNSSEEKNKKRRKLHHHHRDHHADGDEQHRSKRSRQSRHASKYEREESNLLVQKEKKGRIDGFGIQPQEDDGGTDKTAKLAQSSSGLNHSGLKRDSWMEAPSAGDVEYTQKVVSKSAKHVSTSGSLKADFQLKIHENELNKHHLEDLAEGRHTTTDTTVTESTRSGNHDEVDYTFGDEGAQWRMTKLKAVYKQAEDSSRPVELIAIERYGALRAFDDAREEQIELDRRETYGDGYVIKKKPSGELSQERAREEEREGRTENRSVEPLLQEGKPRNKHADSFHDGDISSQSLQLTTRRFDHTALNRLKAQLLKARLRGTPEVPTLETEYAQAMDSFSSQPGTGIVVLGTMENRMLTGGRQGEVITINTKRGRERGLVRENEDMSIEDMVKEERRTRNQAGGDGKRFAERIAKDGKFDNNLDYMEENATKLSKRVHKSEINLKNTAISDFQKMNRILDRCPLCHREDDGVPPIAPIVSLATRVYLTLPTEPEIGDGGAVIVPIQHRGNLLECDDDEWEEIRNFMKSLIRMYHDQGRDVIFYENAAEPQRRKHATMEVVPLPYSLGETAPAFFKEAILTADEEWTQHKKIIDTLSKAKQGGLGKLAFRRTLVKEMPYFHVWFEIDGGLGHIVEDANRWPRGDLFAREVIGGMLDKGPDIIKRQGRWNRGTDRRVDGFRKRWSKFDWTKILTNS